MRCGAGRSVPGGMWSRGAGRCCSQELGIGGRRGLESGTKAGDKIAGPHQGEEVGKKWLRLGGLGRVRRRKGLPHQALCCQQVGGRENLTGRDACPTESVRLVVEAKPCLVAFREVRAFPDWLVGPAERAALARFRLTLGCALPPGASGAAFL
jgi:hypothetical protein